MYFGFLHMYAVCLNRVANSLLRASRMGTVRPKHYLRVLYYPELAVNSLLGKRHPLATLLYL